MVVASTADDSVNADVFSDEPFALRWNKGYVVSATFHGLLWQHPKKRDVLVAWSDARLLERWERKWAYQDKTDVFEYGYCLYADSRKFVEWTDAPDRQLSGESDISWEQKDALQRHLLAIITTRTNLPVRVIESSVGTQKKRGKRRRFGWVALVNLALFLLFAGVPLTTGVLALTAPFTRNLALNLLVAALYGSMGLLLLVLIVYAVMALDRPDEPKLPPPPIELPLVPPPTVIKGSHIVLKATMTLKERVVSLILFIVCLLGAVYLEIRSSQDFPISDTAHPRLSDAHQVIQGLFLTCTFFGMILLGIGSFSRAEVFHADDTGMHWENARSVSLSYGQMSPFWLPRYLRRAIWCRLRSPKRRRKAGRLAGPLMRGGCSRPRGLLPTTWARSLPPSWRSGQGSSRAPSGLEKQSRHTWTGSRNRTYTRERTQVRCLMVATLSLYVSIRSRHMPEITANGLRFYVVDEGSGTPVVLLHGFPDTSYLWRHLIPELTNAGFRAIAPDLRGRGKSERPAKVEDYALTTSVVDVAAIMDTLGVERAHVIAHDWGAAVGWLFASLKPERVDHLVAVSVPHPSTRGKPSLEELQKGWYRLLFLFPNIETALQDDDWYLMRTLIQHGGDLDRYLEDLSEPGALTAALNWYRGNISPERLNAPPARLPLIQAPTMGVFSTGDLYLTEDAMKRSAEFVAGPWRYERIEGVSHWIPSDAPERFNQLVLDFLRH